MIGFGSRVFRFSEWLVDGDGSMRALLGGKGSGLAEMCRLKIPVPPGFTISTAVCNFWLEHGRLPAGVDEEIAAAVEWLEDCTGRKLGDPADPLLVSVRSGAAISMPGMMDTVLNVGLNEACCQGLARRSGSRRFALDSYRRLLQMFGEIVLQIPRARLDSLLPDQRSCAASALSEGILEPLVAELKRAIQFATGHPFPVVPRAQVAMAIEAVFRSWRCERARCYRRLHGIEETLGTAVTIQAMVFGNRGEKSGTGVGFTRHPSTGERLVFGEFLANAQGEDIVAGNTTPSPLDVLARTMPYVHRQLVAMAEQLETHYRDVQDFEFTVEEGRLFLLQTRAAKRSAVAAIRTAVEMANEKLISRDEAIGRITPRMLQEVLAPQLDVGDAEVQPLTQGLAASAGAACGQIALSSHEAVRMAEEGLSVILVTEETTADDIHGMAAAAGFLTSRGGATSHAAVVARGMGKCCITGAQAVVIDAQAATVRIGGATLRAGEWLSLEGNTGRAFEGKLPLRPADAQDPHLQTLLGWARQANGNSVRANADTPEDACRALAEGAAGIGLCRTEHMFFAPERLPHMRAMILAVSQEERLRELNELLPMQQTGFEEMFRIMSGRPVTIRLLDPPLHEFLPSRDELDGEITSARREEDWDLATTLEKMRERAAALGESNPMMGHRGCRLSITSPEILHMQVVAILQAALRVRDQGYTPEPEIMVPLVASEEEMSTLAGMIRKTAAEVFAREGTTLAYRIGSMIELPRAALVADAIAVHVDFLSFGTNDLTQMTYGFSRDDSRTYIDPYIERKILTADPFVTVDRKGVGALMELAIRSAKGVHPGVKIGVCGEHGGDPASIEYFYSIGVDYVSCSSSRLATAQLAAAQAARTRASAMQISHDRLPATEAHFANASRGTSLVPGAAPV
jgi:pyruvate,orthophosphate dikinase